MKLKLALMFALTCGLAATATAFAHHSFSAEFDANQHIEFSGVVTKVDWTNPHTYFYVDVENDDGDVNNWAIELGSPNVLMRQGWTRNSLKIGDVVSVSGSRAKDGSYKGNARSVVLSTGQRLFAGSSQTYDEDKK